MIKIVYKYAIIALVFYTTACSYNKQTKPEPFFERKTMADILTDISIAEAGVNQAVVYKDSFDAPLKTYHDFIYKKYNTNQKEFTDNYTYYTQNPILLDSIYNDVLNNLTELRIKKSTTK